ncbi:MAG: hypothetical protein JJLCMIEE_02859 [Acidimicrobiales bacterium]|nr:MAG: hypothetical protein EDR02_13525 [Actinomycetota bacterium]MBV6509760.1 hypothetical protein [Acidimicrobiales bacterium]RIK04846.1 MAG: hypothetical protein DCC48_12465 [Acidobacteriota bacterium]
MRERGQAAPLVLIVLSVTVLMLVVISAVGRAVMDRARAQTVADVSALAGAVTGESEAADLAAANGGELVSFETAGEVVVVIVAEGIARASAAATASGE